MLKLLLISFIFVLSSLTFANNLFKNEQFHRLDSLALESEEEIDTLFFSSLEKYGVDLDLIECLPLFEKIIEWEGTPYRYGGNSKKGIDCSRLTIELTNSIYYDSISGSAATLYDNSHKLNLEELSEGDLVFFKINKSYVSHVGVYLQNNLFVHATRGKGVVISSLDETYYKKYYFGAGRLID